MNVVKLVEQEMPDWFVNIGTKDNPSLTNLKTVILEALTKKSTPDWLKHFNIPSNCILDPDGWDRKNFSESWHEPISEEEFMSRVCKSTVMLSHHSLAILRGKYTTLLESKVKV